MKKLAYFGLAMMAMGCEIVYEEQYCSDLEETEDGWGWETETGWGNPNTDGEETEQAVDPQLRFLDNDGSPDELMVTILRSDDGQDMRLLEGLHFERDVEVMDMEFRRDEAIVVLLIAQDAELGSVRVSAEFDGENALLAEAFEIVDAASNTGCEDEEDTEDGGGFVGTETETTSTSTSTETTTTHTETTDGGTGPCEE